MGLGGVTNPYWWGKMNQIKCKNPRIYHQDTNRVQIRKDSKKQRRGEGTGRITGVVRQIVNSENHTA